MTDEYIIEKVLDGNTHIFSEIVERYKNKVFNMVYRFTNDYNESQDLSQEVFINVFKNLHKFNQKAKFSTWLYRISYNICIDWCRKNKKKKKDLLANDNQNDIADDKLNVEDNYISKQGQIILRNLINSMDEKYRTVLILFHYQGLSYEEIAEVLKLPVKTVETRLYRARRLLKKSLSKEYYGGEIYDMHPGIQAD